MISNSNLEIFLVSLPGLEAALCAEARANGFPDARPSKGGVVLHGGWPDVWSANRKLRGASRILVRIGAFRAFHLAQLDKRARIFPWGETLRTDVPVKVEASCKGSRIYHAGAAAQRIERAIQEELGAPIATRDSRDVVAVKVRIDNDLCTISIDTSGEPLHRRGHKEAVSKAPLRETMAALFLRQCGFDGSQPVVDPMCGSGTFIIEAAEIAAGLVPGRSRTFAFEHLATFDPDAYKALEDRNTTTTPSGIRFFGSDRDAGAVNMSRANAERPASRTGRSSANRPSAT